MWCTRRRTTKSDGLQPKRNGLQPKSDGLKPKSDGLQPKWLPAACGCKVSTAATRICVLAADPFAVHRSHANSTMKLIMSVITDVALITN